MLLRFTAPLWLWLVAAGSVQAADIAIQVGGKNGFKFNPDEIHADVGDSLIFKVGKMDGSPKPVPAMIVRSAGPSNPCRAREGNNFVSPRLAWDGQESFSVTVNNTDPIYVFEAGHCKSDGTVMIINAYHPKTDVTALVQAAKLSPADGSAPLDANLTASVATGGFPMVQADNSTSTSRLSPPEGITVVTMDGAKGMRSRVGGVTGVLSGFGMAWLGMAVL